MPEENRGLELLAHDQKGYLQKITNTLNEAGFAVLDYKHGFEENSEGKFRSTGIVDLKIVPAFMIH